MKVDVKNWKNETVSTVDLLKDVFSAPIDKPLMHSVVRWQLACRRQGTHQAKTRAMVRGGGAKPFRQKGTGRARQGSSRSPLLEGGGVIFPPSPKDYSYSFNKKQKQKALRSALSYLYQNKAVKVVDEMKTKKGKTKELVELLKVLKTSKALLIDHSTDSHFSRSARNLKDCRYGSVGLLNVYELLKYSHLIVTKDTLPELYKKCGVKGER